MSKRCLPSRFVLWYCIQMTGYYLDMLGCTSDALYSCWQVLSYQLHTCLFISVWFLCFAINTTKIEMDNIPTASAHSEFPLPSQPLHDFAKCCPSADSSTQSKIIWCICFIDPSDTATRYPSLLRAVRTSLIVVSMLFYFFGSGENCTNSTRSLPILLNLQEVDQKTWLGLQITCCVSLVLLLITLRACTWTSTQF